MTDTLIKNAYVISMDDNIGTLKQGDVLIRGRDIAAVGNDLDTKADKTIDGTGRIVMPGLIDGHRHMFSGMPRGGCSDTSYTGNQGGYFEIVIRRFGGNFTPDDTYTSSRLGALGVTQRWHHHAPCLGAQHDLSRSCPGPRPTRCMKRDCVGDFPTARPTTPWSSISKAC